MLLPSEFLSRYYDMDSCPGPTCFHVLRRPESDVPKFNKDFFGMCYGPLSSFGYSSQCWVPLRSRIWKRRRRALDMSPAKRGAQVQYSLVRPATSKKKFSDRVLTTICILGLMSAMAMRRDCMPGSYPTFASCRQFNLPGQSRICVRLCSGEGQPQQSFLKGMRDYTGKS